jgi:hypothetical protein
MDPHFRVSSTAGGLAAVLGIGLVLLFFLAFSTSAPGGAPLGPTFVLPFLLFGGVVAGVAVLLALSRPNAAVPPTRLSPGGPSLASGGRWSIAEPDRLIAVPNRSHRLHVTFVPAEDFQAVGVRASVKAVETWWTRESTTDANGNASSKRVKHRQTLLELPLPVSGPAAYGAGRAVEWDLAFDLDGVAPSSGGDRDLLACEWQLDVSIDRPLRSDARFSQPVLVTQPRDRLNAGVVDEPQFSRYEEVTASDGNVQVDFRVLPTPLDLAAPASVDVRVANANPAIVGRAVRLEIYVRSKVTARGGEAREQVVWSARHALSTLPSGVTDLHFDVPAINLAWPDMDLPHGWMRGAMRLVVDIPAGPDVRVGRDLCLCLDKPGLPSTGSTPLAGDPSGDPAA